MKTSCAILAVCFTSAQAFTSPLSTRTQPVSRLSAYVPAGLSAEEFKRIKAADQKKMGKNLGGLGPRGFKSRSMQSWQEAYEHGETGHALVRSADSAAGCILL